MNHNPLGALLGLTQAASVAAPDPLEEAPEGQIVVEADAMDPYRYENPQAVTQRDLGIEAGREASDHKGMFGVRGTLRDVLGVVGDAFLIQSGNNPIYAPHKRQEEMSDAMAGFTEDPLAAIERVAGINPEAAAKMYEQYQMNQYRSGQVGASNLRANTNATREARMGREQAMDYVSQAYAAAIASGDPTAMAKALELAQTVSANTGLSLAELGVSENMTPQEAAVLAGRSATVNQNLRLPQQERSLDIREEQERGRNRRNNQNEAGRNRRASQAEAGRNRRAGQTDRRVRELDRRGSSGPRSLRNAGENRPRFEPNR